MKYYVFGMWIKGPREEQDKFFEHMRFNGYKVDDTGSYNSSRGWLVNIWVPVESCETWDINDKPGYFHVGEAKKIGCSECGGSGIARKAFATCEKCRGRGYRYE